jgi:hypothetical protein
VIPAPHGAICTCPKCRRERVALDRLARLTARAALRAAEAEAAAGVLTQSLPGITIAWGPQVPLPGKTSEAARQALARAPASLDQRSRLYRIAIARRDVYVGMAPSSTVRQRLDSHLRKAKSAEVSAQSPKGDEARLHALLGQAFARGRAITVRVGSVLRSHFYGDVAHRGDRKLLHAFEILSAFDLLARRPPETTAYDRLSWTFEQDPEEDRA